MVDDNFYLHVQHLCFGFLGCVGVFCDWLDALCLGFLLLASLEEGATEQCNMLFFTLLCHHSQNWA